MTMNIRIGLLLAASLASLSACNGKGTDKLAENVEKAADNRADGMESQADALRNQAKMLDKQAEKTRDYAEDRADAIKAADVNAAAMNPEQREAVIDNQAAAVR
jgi:CMP-2-keto-3-deoxyoctulosonic acid synthetase